MFMDCKDGSREKGVFKKNMCVAKNVAVSEVKNANGLGFFNRKMG